MFEITPYNFWIVHKKIIQGERDRQAGRQAGRQTGRQTDRQTDRQTGRQADRQTDRERRNLIYWYYTQSIGE